MLAPAAGLIGLFVLLPMLLSIWLSFQDWSTQTPFSTATFIGLDNFREIFGSTSVGRDFKGALVNTAIYTLLSVMLILPLSVLLGLMVYQRAVPGTTALRTILFSTYMVPMIAVALVWSKLYSPTEGPINQMLGLIGIGPLPWLASPRTALISIVILNVWQQVGYFTVLAVAGLTQIPGTSTRPPHWMAPTAPSNFASSRCLCSSARFCSAPSSPLSMPCRCSNPWR
jgi:multiple sugar transport system permease protein/sn-glycerol 3-phosphate transport system permease protein